MIHLFCALPCEAEPLIQHYRLKQEKHYDLFRVFVSEQKDISLTITGIGKLNAAAAVSYLHACLHSTASDIWLNIGVAGHGDMSIGDIYMANKITDATTGQNWYPQILFDAPWPSMALQTLDTPSDDYQHTLFDMEASGFYSMAIRLGTAELIHSIKIISDNREQNTKTVKAAAVRQHIANHLTNINGIIQLLMPFANELNSIALAPRAFEQIVAQWHFTETERIQLRHLLQHWQSRLSEIDVLTSIQQQKSAKTVLQHLRQTLIETPFNITHEELSAS